MISASWGSFELCMLGYFRTPPLPPPHTQPPLSARQGSVSLEPYSSPLTPQGAIAHNQHLEALLPQGIGCVLQCLNKLDMYCGA